MYEGNTEGVKHRNWKMDIFTCFAVFLKVFQLQKNTISHFNSKIKSFWSIEMQFCCKSGHFWDIKKTFFWTPSIFPSSIFAKCRFQMITSKQFFRVCGKLRQLVDFIIQFFSRKCIIKPKNEVSTHLEHPPRNNL